MDDQTRFWIALQVADTKYTSNVRPLFAQAKEIAQKRPNTFINDGAPNFHDAFNKEFFTIGNPRTIFLISDCKENTIITKWRDSMARSET